MKKTLRLSILTGTLVLLAAAGAAGQQPVAYNREGATPVKVKRPTVARLEELGADLTALKKRKAAVRAFLSNADPSSPEYGAARDSLVEIEVKLQDVARDMARLGFSRNVAATPKSGASRDETDKAARDLANDEPSAEPNAEPPAAPPVDTITASAGRVDQFKAQIDINISQFFGDEVVVQAKEGNKVLSTDQYRILGEFRRTGTFRVEVPLAASGDTVVTVSSLDGSVTTTVTIPANTPPTPPPPAAGKPSRLVGLLLGGTVISQQAENLSQADPFVGFIVGYDDQPSGPKDDSWRAHWRVQTIFQVQPKKEEAPVEGTGEGMDNDGDGTPDPADFRSFLASRKSFDIEMSFWYDRPAKQFIFFGGGGSDPNLRIGPYVAVGGTAYVSKNELKGDEPTKVEADAADPVDTDENGQVELDVERSKVDNDIDYFAEAGLIGTFTRNSKLFMQAKIGYGRYEALAGLNPGKTGFFNDSRNRFVGKLRIFPMLLDRDPEGTADASPMFGVEINAGRGPDQIKFFTGVATAFKLLKR